MGQCYGKTIPTGDNDGYPTTTITTTAASDAADLPSRTPLANGTPSGKNTPSRSSAANSPWPSPYPFGAGSAAPAGASPSPARSTPLRFFKKPFPPPSPAKHIRASLRKLGQKKKSPREGPIPEDAAAAAEDAEHQQQQQQQHALDKNFGYNKNFGAKYELGKEVGRGHFGHTCYAKGRKGELKDLPLAVKIISKAKMTTAISIEDVRREVKILKALSGHRHLVRFYDACEDANNVYIIMELCEGGELLDRILSKGGRYTEEEAKLIIVQILSVVAFCHLQGVVHRDLKPENFLFTSRSEDADMKLIDFGLSDFIRTDERLNDIVGSAYYVAPEVLHRSYSVEADIWSIGVITYILLCGSRPFWARTESGIFRSVLRADPNFDDMPWPSVSPHAKDFVKRLLNKDYRKRMTAAQALTHPWLRSESHPIPLDILVYKLVKSYLHATPFKRAALKALSKALSEDELVYLRAQFMLLEPSEDGRVSLENFKKALARNATDAMKASRVPDILHAMAPLSYRKMEFEEFCAGAISTYQLEALEKWEQIASTAFEHFEEEGNRVISVEELARELNVGPSAHSMLRDWLKSNGKLSLLGFTRFLHGLTLRSSNIRHH
ncbi:CDPK-related kinase 3 [Perilla frutescens var. hirtella]|uniref:non-specific serine/threonine protein kinase n=1 Tax=Perilla frutescens var. hirtella TaxID=608512 RepID=A0AAD4PE81_PERFH|nr:CDPK-related kinase 3 [Perilla frutescens var. hirtella]KAH6814894.1 CDPK-related kinase 3 [Perilla frutescens var. frutescens]KAH6819644.1 CDPK-related kinase 3 [Perilla frutescens var. frutescens]KAH6835677.1 CDPK-related kinase 3 [Perilla frutescens var. hirtella]